MPSERTLRMHVFRACVAETLGTYLLVLFGTGAVASAVFTGAHVGLWQIAAVWGFGITLAIYATAATSGAHLNPAVSLAFALFRSGEFHPRLLLPYWAAQLAGGILGGLTILWLFGPLIARYEAQHGLLRGTPGSERSAMVFGEYFPNPALFGTGPEAHALISPASAMVVEAFGTGVLVFVIFALIERHRGGVSPGHLAPFFIGFTVAVLISLFAPLTQGGWNPARDLGPRIVAYFAGWGHIAIPGPVGGFWVYLVGPLVGGPLGAGIYEVLLRPAPSRQGARRFPGNAAAATDDPPDE